MLVHQNSVEFLLNPLTWKCQSAASASRTSHLCQSPVAFRPDSDGHCCHDPTNHTSLLGSWSSFPSSRWTWEKKMYNTTSRWIMLPLKLLWKIHTTLYNHFKKKNRKQTDPSHSMASSTIRASRSFSFASFFRALSLARASAAFSTILREPDTHWGTCLRTHKRRVIVCIQQLSII